MTPRDPGLQPERTQLAWRRTALSLTAVAVLTVRLALALGAAGAVLALIAMAVWVVVIIVSLERATGTPGRRIGSGPAMVVTALAAVGYALLDVVLVVAGLR